MQHASIKKEDIPISGYVLCVSAQQLDGSLDLALSQVGIALVDVLDGVAQVSHSTRAVCIILGVALVLIPQLLLQLSDLFEEEGLVVRGFPQGRETQLVEDVFDGHSFTLVYVVSDGTMYPHRYTVSVGYYLK